MSTNNVLVHESIADDFISILQQETKEIRAGHQVDDKHQLRGLYDQASAKRIADLVDDGIARGAKLVVGNHDIHQNIEGSVVQPIVLDHVVQGMRVADEEIFGPVLGITRFRTDEEAIQIANSSQYGLASAIHSRDISRALKIAQKLDAAGVHINSFTLRTHANHPYGGSKASGFGRFNGLEGIREFTQSKVITITNIGVTPNL
ncbi:hypothetical protein BS47DRAFT_1041081 [Hydnum rufescens UP504]|uniref:Aldehyde dehydrogenase domain-containing protein n=1 Tax=Hydnum rufescens UP504 TaxID=1448309 RepID=A0A9P6AWJ1_9AGAM|nr:hypothetical protein BS47DRAFT_1041081 [Hydnum rufescens UP504]